MERRTIDCIDFWKGADYFLVIVFEMELILISDSKLKIMLTNEDMREYSLDCKSLDYANTETRRAFWSILDEAKHRTGFDAARERVFVQVYPSLRGGCEMFVTKIGDADIKNDYRRGTTYKDGRDLETSELIGYKSNKREIALKRTMSFKIRNISTLLALCRRLDSMKYAGQSGAYRDDRGAWYLILEERGNRNLIDFISEYGESVDSDFLDAYISEHGKIICSGDAIKTLARL